MTAREQIEKAAANHGWDATIEGRWLNEYRKGDHTVVAYWRPDGTVKDVTHFRGDIGLAYLAPTDGVVDWTVGQLAGRC